MAEPERNLTPGDVCNILIASKESGDEYFSEHHQLEIRVSGGEGLLLRIALENHTCFDIEFQEMHRKGKYFVSEGDVRFGSSMFQYYRKSNDTITIFCNRPDKVLESIFEHLKTGFGLQFERLEIVSGDFNFPSVQYISRWLRAKQYPLKCLLVRDEGVPMDQDQFKFILDNFKPTDRVHTDVEVPPGFSYNFDNTCDTVWIGVQGDWLTLANLLNKRSLRIVVRVSSFTNRDMVEYLSQWTPRPMEIGYEIVDLQLQEPVDMAEIVSQIPGCQETARIHRNSIEERRIKFQDGRIVHFKVNSNRPRVLIMYLWPPRPEDQ